MFSDNLCFMYNLVFFLQCVHQTLITKQLPPKKKKNDCIFLFKMCLLRWRILCKFSISRQQRLEIKGVQWKVKATVGVFTYGWIFIRPWLISGGNKSSKASGCRKGTSLSQVNRNRCYHEHNIRVCVCVCGCSLSSEALSFSLIERSFN